MKRIGLLQKWKWNRNPIATIYDHDQVRQDPESSARRTLNVHAVAGFGALFVAVFQIAITLFFYHHHQQQKKSTGGDRTTTTSTTAAMTFNTKSTSSTSSSITDTMTRRVHCYMGRAIVIVWLFVYITGIVYFVTATTYFGIKDQEELPKKLGRMLTILVFMYVGTISIVNAMIGY